MSELLDKVAKAMWGTSDVSEWERDMARKAVLAVAEWIGPEYCVTKGNLEKQVERK